MTNEPSTIDLDALADVTGGATLPRQPRCPLRDWWDWIRGRISPGTPVPDSQSRS